jgi:hypothetical protein
MELMKPNTSFTLDVKDIELIERALTCMIPIDQSRTNDIVALKAKLFQQKNWYGKTSDGTPYVSG